MTITSMDILSTKRDKMTRALCKIFRVNLVDLLMHVSSSKDRDLVNTKISCYRIVKEIWELDYIKFKGLCFDISRLRITTAFGSMS